LVGNKIDLEEERCVLSNEGEICAKKFNMKFNECSALNSFNVNEIFNVLINDILVNFYIKDFEIIEKWNY